MRALPRFLALCGVVLLWMLLAAPASASTISCGSFTSSQQNFTGNVGTVTDVCTMDSSTFAVTKTFTYTPAAGITGNGIREVGFNFTGTAGTTFTSGNEDGFGQYAATFNFGGNKTNTVTVNFTGSSTFQETGFVAHISWLTAAGTECSGWIGGGAIPNGTVGIDPNSPAACGGGGQGQPPVPEPASLILFGTGLSGVGLFVRRRLNK